jgi:hypothetical protein
MWTCLGCGEQLEEQFDVCWNCGTSRDGDHAIDSSSEDSVGEAAEQTFDQQVADMSPEKMLSQILHLQKEQQEALSEIQSKVGCLFMYMVVGIVLTLLGVILGVLRSLDG